MYSRSYNTSNRVPLNYNGTSIQIEEPKAEEKAVIEITENNLNTEELIETTEPEEYEDYLFVNRPYARVPLMDKSKYSPVKPPAVHKHRENNYDKPNIKTPDKKPLPDNKPLSVLAKKINADDILLIGLLIVLLGCENVDLKLIIAIAVLLFVGF